LHGEEHAFEGKPATHESKDMGDERRRKRA